MRAQLLTESTASVLQHNWTNSNRTGSPLNLSGSFTFFVFACRLCLRDSFLGARPSAQHLRGHPSAADPTGAVPGPTLGTLPLVTHLLSGKEPLSSSRDCKCLPGIYRGAMSVGEVACNSETLLLGVPERMCPGTSLSECWVLPMLRARNPFRPSLCLWGVVCFVWASETARAWPEGKPVFWGPPMISNPVCEIRGWLVY